MNYLSDPGYEPILRGVLSSPEDMAPRLVLADWLLEHADPEANRRGRAIQDALAGQSVRRRDARCLLGGLEARFAHWRVVHHLSPVAASPIGPNDSPVTFHMRLGFVYRVELDVRGWDEHAAFVFARHPITETQSSHLPRRVRLRKSGREAYVWHRRADTYNGWLPAGLFGAVLDQPEITVRAADFCGVPVPAADGFTGQAWRRDEAQDQAREALDRAIIEWGRRQAGLDPAGRAA